MAMQESASESSLRWAPAGDPYKRSTRLLPLKREFEWAREQLNPALDPSFTATYGPVLSRLRARFLKDAHPAWEVFGKWLRSSFQALNPDQAYDAYELAWVLRDAAEAGVFFDGLDPVVDVLLPLACGVAARYFRVLISSESSRKPRPSLLWALHIRPHTQTILANLMSRFPLVKRGEDGELLGGLDDDHVEGHALVELVKYMTKDEQTAYFTQLGLMIKNLDYDWDYSWNGCVDSPPRNVAIDVFHKYDGAFQAVLPAAHVALILDYALHVPEVDRCFTALQLLAGLDRRLQPALASALKDVSEDVLKGVVDRMWEVAGDLGGELYWSAVVNVLLDGGRKVSKGFLRRMAKRIEGREDPGEGFRDPFHQLCRLSLTDERVIEKLINMTPGW